jgi:1-acyl-sn-glycerol-3-phosphate acyltransferase
MRRMLYRAWRQVRTGASFALFGVLCVLVTFVIVPALRVLERDPQRREFRCQYAVHLCFRLFVWSMELWRVMELDVRGRELLREPGQLVVANHPSLLDVVFIISAMPQADCVVKKEAWSNPFMRGVVDGAGYLPNDGGSGIVEACAERLRRGRSLVLFPEGTRSPEGGLGPFRRGAIHAALASGVRMRTVVITSDPPTLMRGQPWWDVPDRRPRFTLDCREVLDPAAVLDGTESRGIAARKIAAALRDLYAKRLQSPGPR